MATEEDGRGGSWRHKTRLPLEEAMHVVALGRGFSPDDYAARSEACCSWSEVIRRAEEIGHDPLSDGHLPVLLPTRDQGLLVRHPEVSWTTRTRGPVTEAVKDRNFGDAMERAFKELCEAAYESEVQLDGIGPDGQHGTIPPLLFGPGAPGEPVFAYPLRFESATEPPLAIIWDNAGAPCLEWKNVHVDRGSLERWLAPRRPDPAQFDPMQEVYWTLPMAVAWGARRSVEEVRQNWDAWIEGCLERRSGADGYRYWQRPAKPSVSMIALEDEPATQAWRQLKQKLQSGDIITQGRNIETGEVGPIPAAHWRYLEERLQGPDFEPHLRYSKPVVEPERGYDDVFIARTDVLRLWSGASGEASASESGAPSQPRRGRGAPVEYPEDDILVEEVLATLERDPETVMRPLILNLALKHGCHPDLLDDMDRLVDRVRKKVKKTRDRITDQKAD